ncbi:MAG: alpha-E domain-containing protein, partial [Pseudomonadota bacterium]|nr:alpha-E domain-containing protein [Pseudomonadota bacterium]
MTLGKTAGGLYWMFRYLERSENTTRLLDAGFRMSLTRSASTQNEWRSVLETTGATYAFSERHEEADLLKVVDFLLRDRSNQSSILSVMEAARENAR